jgi:GT2 family glycosyltransferase
MARFEALEQIGYFDPEFFLYWEEVELMQRAAQLGWECWHVPRAEVFHREGASTGISSRESPPARRPSYWYESWSIYFRKVHGRGYALVAASLWLIGAAINRLFVSAGRTRQSVPKDFYLDFWKYGIRPLLRFATRSSLRGQLLPISRAGRKGMSR